MLVAQRQVLKYKFYTLTNLLNLCITERKSYTHVYQFPSTNSSIRQTEVADRSMRR